MNALLITDLHLTGQPREEYRWRIFEWVEQITAELGVSQLFILGDLTESKDYHSSRIVNRIANALVRLPIKTVVLRGNHDGLDPNLPYFHFLRFFESVQFIATPYALDIAGQRLVMLPHSRDPARDWENPEGFLTNADLVFMHQTVAGAKSENNQTLEGIAASLLTVFRRSARIWSGDVHVPQVINGVEYIGAPYAVRFGDVFEPRAVLLKNMREQVDIPNTWAPKRRFLTVYPDAKSGGYRIEGADGLAPADQVKVRVRLAAHEYVDWQRCKDAAAEYCSTQQLELCGIELERVKEKPRLIKRGAPVSISTVQPSELLRRYCAENNISDEVASFGAGLLDASK